MPKRPPDYEEKDVSQYLYFKQWTPDSLREMRKRLKLTQADIAKAMDITAPSISAIENGRTMNPWAIQLYGIILERYQAGILGYRPTYIRTCDNVFMEGYDELSKRL